MRQYFQWSLIFILVLLSACAPRYKTLIFEEGKRYTVMNEGKSLFSVVKPLGTWGYSEKLIKEGMLMIGGGCPYEWVGCSARVSMGKAVRPDHEVDLIDKLLNQNYQDIISRKLEKHYTQARRKEVGYTDVKGSVVKLAGLTCQRFQTAQDYGPSASSTWGDSHLDRFDSSITCPLIVDGVFREFYFSYDVSIATNKFRKVYGDAAPSVEEILAEIERRLQPMIDSLEFYGEVSQTLTTEPNLPPIPKGMTYTEFGEDLIGWRYRGSLSKRTQNMTPEQVLEMQEKGLTKAMTLAWREYFLTSFGPADPQSLAFDYSELLLAIAKNWPE